MGLIREYAHGYEGAPIKYAELVEKYGAETNPLKLD
jgi:hypothetical protein